ncbi:MAG: hypothetical protein IH855_06605 [Bacteroidetes bacterium]|nr:hypothetical protein [Bacteroidota bacterium]
MESIAVKVLDPAGQHWAQLLDPTQKVRRLLPLLVERLGLPDDLKYELVPEGASKALSMRSTLLEAGVVAGASLVLRPIRDGFLSAFLDNLYREAVSFGLEQGWDKVKAHLDTIYRLDPNYPDKRQLRKKVGIDAAKGVAGGAAGTGAGVAGSTAAGAAASSAATSAASSSAGAAASGGGSAIGCIFVILIGAVVLGGVLIFTGTIEAPDWLSGIIPQNGTGGTTVVDGVEVGTGDVRVTLTWNTSADIDLHVTDPMGEEVYFGNRQATSGGELDVDANGGCSNDPTVENIFWPTGQAPYGFYQVRVDYFGACGAGATNYEVTVSVDGRVVDSQSGVLSSSADSATLPGFTR